MTLAADPNSLHSIPVGLPSRQFVNQPSRPMLARDADSMYWMTRYVERAEHVARLLMVTSNLLMDVGDLAPELQARQWQSIPTIMRLPDLSETDGNLSLKVAQSFTFDPENPNSLLNCVSRARENARSIRETISAEMWENLNKLYWSISGDDAPAKFEESSDDFYRSVMTGSMLFQGLTDQTLPHDQRWNFAQLAKHFERIDVTCRVIETKYNILQGTDMVAESAIRNLQWTGALRSCCSIEAYRRHHLGDMDPLKVASFLLLEKNFPRSVRFSVHAAHAAISGIRAGINPDQVDAAERILGRLDAQLEYAELNEILNEGLPSYLDRIQTAIADAAIAVQKAYFLH